MSKIQESGEMYLETIYVLSQKGSGVRSLDVAEEMGYSKPSISRAVGLLKSDGLVLVDQDGFLTLTPAGLSIARKIYERHITLSALLTQIGVSPDTATRDACRMEHVISDETFEALRAHVQSTVSGTPAPRDPTEE